MVFQISEQEGEDNEGSAVDEAKRPRVQSVARAVAILAAVSRNHNGISRKAISLGLKLSTQTTYHLLHTLTQCGLVTRNEEGNYILGLKVGSLAEGFRRQLPGNTQISALVRQIARKSGETTYSIEWNDGEIVVNDVVKGRLASPDSVIQHGFAEDAHARAGGKLLLAYATDEQRRHYFATHKLTGRTPQTITSIDELESHFSIIRMQGYAVERGEFAVGRCCIALPIEGGFLPYAIGITAPSDRFGENATSYLQVMRSALAEIIPNF